MKRVIHCHKKVRFKDGTEDTLPVYKVGGDYIITRGGFKHRLVSKRAKPMPQALDDEISLVFGATVISTDYVGTKS
jgi:hypothetical protein